jgi:hypothetical protein
MTTTTATRTTPARPEPNRTQTTGRQNAPTCSPSARPTRAMQRRLIARLVG